jgi:hypothetical protein
MSIKAIGIDLAKSVFSLYGIDDHGVEQNPRGSIRHYHLIT